MVVDYVGSMASWAVNSVARPRRNSKADIMVSANTDRPYTGAQPQN
jgi:hypothetical protein